MTPRIGRRGVRAARATDPCDPAPRTGSKTYVELAAPRGSASRQSIGPARIRVATRPRIDQGRRRQNRMSLQCAHSRMRSEHRITRDRHSSYRHPSNDVPV